MIVATSKIWPLMSPGRRSSTSPGSAEGGRLDLLLKDLADKTRRGLRGRVEAGCSGGGNAYGYDVVHEPGADGLPVRGVRRINPGEAAVVRRIFAAYAAGRSARRIAHDLNAEGVPAPGGRSWGASTISGNAARGIGILNNELYFGRLVWNKLRYIKDPETGRRVSPERARPLGREGGAGVSDG